MDKRKTWRAQEQELVARWNSAVTRHKEAMAQIALAGGDATSETRVLEAEADRARAEVDALRREVARLKVEFNSGKRY